MAAPTPIPLEWCISGRDLTEPRSSPDGASVAFVVRWSGASGIVVVPVEGGPERLLSTAPPPAPGRGLGGGCHDWTPDGDAVVYAAADGQIWRQPIGSGAPVQLTAHEPERRAEAPTCSPDGVTVVYVLDQAEVWECRADGSGEARRLDDGSADFVFDPHVTPSGTTRVWTAWDVPDMPWDAARVERLVVATGERERVGAPGAAVQQPRSLPDGRPICVRDDTGWRNVWIADAPMLDEPVEHAGPTWGMRARTFASSPDGTRVAFTRNEDGFGRLCVATVDTDGRAVRVDEVARGVHGQLHWVGERLVALRTGARTPTQVVAYDTADWSRRVLAVGPVAGWDRVELPEPEALEVVSDDVVVPARRYAAGRGRALCWIHGGPTDQWQVAFMPRVVYWWSRGWDVIVPDPRGTTGHGRAHEQGLRGGWGIVDVDDSAAVIRHAHAAGWCAPDTTVAIGGSSGGLTVLGLLAHHAPLVAGGVASYPVTDLVDLAERSHRFEAHYTDSLVGPIDDVELQRRRSPLAWSDRIAAPLLVMHGDEDPVVPVEGSRRLVEAVRAAGGDVTYEEMAGEGHGFRQPEHQRREYALVADFLTRVVAGAGSAGPASG